MANVLRSDLHWIDVVSATPVTTSRVWVQSIRWVGPMTSGHTATITDPVTAEVLWDSVSAGTGGPPVGMDTFPFGVVWSNGYVVNDLDSGHLLIYLRQGG